MNMILAIAAGGALGSVSRHFAGKATLAAFGLSFPYGTMLVNIAGSLLMGLCVAAFAHHGEQFSPEMKAFLTVGFLGGFTTFSAFSLDAMALWERGDILPAALYVGLSVVVSFAALFGGMVLMRSLNA